MTSGTHGTKAELPVIVVGAGPVGLFAALRLAQFGFDVLVLEKESTLNYLPRATGYFGASLISFKKAGVLEKMQQRGFASAGICWRKPLKDDGHGNKEFGDMVASLPVTADDTPGNITGFVGLPQSQLSELLLEEVLATGRVKVHFNSEFAGLKDDGESVEVQVKSLDTNETKLYRGSFLIGADGSSSNVRKSLGVVLKGHTWPDRLMAIDAYMETPPFTQHITTHMIIDKINYGLITPIEAPGEPGQIALHRCSIATHPNDPRTDEELESDEAVLELMDKFVPGKRPLQVKIRRASTYRLHQRCAGTMRRGRCLLAGDAAHINNPIGAMGLTSGILDADSAADALDLIVHGGKPLSDVLNLYSDERRQVFQFYVDPTTTQNKLRIQQDPENAYDDWFLRKMCNPDVETMRNYGEKLFKVWPTDMRKLVGELK